MKKYVRIGIILIILFPYTFALSATQISNSTLTGKLVENSTKTPMERANVQLFKAKDGFQVSGTTTDKNGIFNFSNLPNGSYYLQVGFIGFTTLKTRPFTIKNVNLTWARLPSQSVQLSWAMWKSLPKKKPSTTPSIEKFTMLKKIYSAKPALPVTCYKTFPLCRLMWMEMSV